MAVNIDMNMSEGEVAFVVHGGRTTMAIYRLRTLTATGHQVELRELVDEDEDIVWRGQGGKFGHRRMYSKEGFVCYGR